MKTKLLFLLLLTCMTSYSQNESLELLFNWTDESLIGSNAYNNTYNEIWGVVVDGREFAVIGSTAGTHIFDVTIPEMSEQVQFIPGSAVGASIIHRDYHDRNGYLYAVSDEGNSSLQIIDINSLPDTALVVYDSNELIKTSHNIFIDENINRMYACNVRTSTANWNSTSLAIFDIEDPVNPIHLLNYEVPGTTYSVHDMWVKNDTAFLNNGGDGFYVVDFSNIDSPQVIGSLTDYPDKGYNHSGWPTSDMNTYIMADEDWGYDMKVLDISNLSDISVITTFGSEIHENSIAHNQIIKGNYVYVSSYHDGLQVYNISDPQNPQKVASYATYLLDDHDSYRGAWGVYPFLPSGNILVSDMQYGLYVIGINGSQLQINRDHELNELNKLHIYPNPSYGIIQLDLPLNEELIDLYFFNINGKLVYKRKIKEDVSLIDLTHLSKGIYIIKGIGINKVYQQKIIVE